MAQNAYRENLGLPAMTIAHDDQGDHPHLGVCDAPAVTSRCAPPCGVP
jgi:hypothetical protein